MPVEISDDDYVSRCIIFPKAFLNFVHTDAVLWQFGKSDAAGASHESGVLRSLAPELKDVHEIGCDIAAIQNERATSGSKRYYCGCRTARVGDIQKESDSYTLVIANVEEHGMKAHVDFALTIKGETKSARATNRTSAGLAIAACFDSPESHICECDKDDHEHPIALYGESCLGGPRAPSESQLPG